MIFRFFLSVLVAIFVSTVANAFEGSWEGHWVARSNTIMLESAIVGERQVMIFGDSNTEQFWWNEVGGCKILNAGFGAAQISDVVSYAEPLAETAKPAIVHIMLGSNNLRPGSNSTGDWRKRWDAMSAGLEKIVRTFKAVGSTVVLWEIPPTSRDFGSASDRDLINATIEKVALDTGVYLDKAWDKGLVAADGYAVSGSVVPDGVHLTAEVQHKRLLAIDEWDRKLQEKGEASCKP
ncbi:SGNH/GDSL hydrolase family protein [Rhizobium sp. 768_B6_N1_8]|uniref:SGNH/GDSL hydrolase family protein n=1 Tax=unclassified Rhizobium TaxID=2613769 RepID=UPI003F285C4E